MMHLNNNNNYHPYPMVTTATISILAIAIIVVAVTSIFPSTPVTATTTAATAAGGNTTTSSGPSSGIKLSPQPIYQESSPPGNITPINQTHGIFTFNGTGMLTLPNSTQTINTTHNGTAFISFTTSSGYGKETIRTQDGETANATVYEIVQSNPATPEVGKGIVTAVFQTNSSGVLAPLNGIIAAGIDDMSAGGASHVTLWKWESGISNIGVAAPTTTEGAPSLNSSNSTTTTANEASPSTSLTAPY
jgi:hypothetical protein